MIVDKCVINYILTTSFVYLTCHDKIPHFSNLSKVIISVPLFTRVT